MAKNEDRSLTIISIIIALIVVALINPEPVGLIVSDKKLIMHCKFDNSLICENGERPSQENNLSFAEGKDSQGILVDNDDYLIYPLPEDFNKEKGTIEIWVKPSWNRLNEGGHIFFNFKHGGQNFWIGTIYFNHFIYFGSAASTIETSIRRWKKEEWHHIAVTWDKKYRKTKFYIDGIYVAQGNYYPMSNLPPYFYLGSNIVKRNQADAIIDEFKIYNYIRTRSQIKEDYKEFAQS